jgi:ribonuclease BN (tRNA processing enzyme)
MNIRVLGTRGEIEAVAHRHCYHSGVLIDDTLLFDLGEPEFLDTNPSAIYITHLHPDHAFFVSRPSPPIDLPIYAPEPYQDSVTVEEMNGPLRTGPYTITPIPTHHSRRVRSTAYLVQKVSESVLYTGDMTWIDKEHHHFADPVDLVITDGSYLRRGGMVRRDKETGTPFGHTGIPDLLRIFSPVTDHILLVHFGSWFYKDMKKARQRLKELGKENNVFVHVGYDGMILDTRTFKDSNQAAGGGKP